MIVDQHKSPGECELCKVSINSLITIRNNKYNLIYDLSLCKDCLELLAAHLHLIALQK